MKRPEILSDDRLEELLAEDFSTAYSGHVEEYRAIAEAQRDDTWEKAREWFRKELMDIDCILGAESRDKALVALIIRLSQLEDRR